MRVVSASVLMVLLAATLAAAAPKKQGSDYKPLPSVKKNINGRAVEVCTTPECTLSAAAIIEALDLTVDPCDDFYQFACGGWAAKNPVPDSSSSWSQFSVLDDQLSNAISKILVEPVDVQEPAPINQAKWLYAQCIDEAAIESAGTTPLTDILAENGGWPMASGSWVSALFNWEFTVAYGRRDYGYSTLLDVWVFADEKSTSETALYLDQTSLGMPRSVLTDQSNYEERFQAYKTYIKTTAQIIAADLGETVDEAALDQQVEDLVAFEVELAAITTPSEDRRDIERMYNPMTIADLDGLMTGFTVSWLSVLNFMFANVGITLESSSRIIVQEIEYIQKLGDLLAVTDQRVVANYLLWRFVKDLGDDTNAAMRDASFQYNKVASGVSVQRSRTDVCADETNSLMGMAVGYKYVAQYFSAQAKNESNYLVEDLRTAFKDLLTVNEWMDDETKPLALEKADAINKFIGYPDWYEEPNGLEDYYVLLTGITASSSHFENIKAARLWWSSTELDDLGAPTDKQQWFMSPTTVNAYYEPEFNSITFPAGILQPVFYRANTLQAINYGAIGQVMGHEITHGFDDQGSQYDKDGNAIPWWSNATQQAFKEKAQCVIDQYESYTVPEIDYLLPGAHVNGINTQGENIADNGGLREAYLAYQLYVQDHGILVDPHSPHQFRVIGPMSNMAEFSSEFQCPLGSKMNPANKCIVW
ncbi:hypothetical protein HAZT_HAZT010641 [Hyalella azteca]|uniref:Endothelin-converting enzyme 1 n=1 Tax=Hyalella azteca TaxID=294128 RepID=A0A6A0HHU2_HYAAZ|nr:hypothetical protein HAZT_HAZT010641 [Hyalella azteca]